MSICSRPADLRPERSRQAVLILQTSHVQIRRNSDYRNAGSRSSSIFTCPDRECVLSPRNLLMIRPLMRARSSVSSKLHRPVPAVQTHRRGRYLRREAPVHLPSLPFPYLQYHSCFQIDLCRTARAFDHNNIVFLLTTYDKPSEYPAPVSVLYLK